MICELQHFSASDVIERLIWPGSSSHDIWYSRSRPCAEKQPWVTMRRVKRPETDSRAGQHFMKSEAAALDRELDKRAARELTLHRVYV